MPGLRPWRPGPTLSPWQHVIRSTDILYNIHLQWTTIFCKEQVYTFKQQQLSLIQAMVSDQLKFDQSCFHLHWLHGRRSICDLEMICTVTSNTYSCYAPPPEGGGIMHWWPLSVCPSVPCRILSPERKCVGNWILAERKTKAINWIYLIALGRLCTSDPWSHLQDERSKVKVTRPLNAVTEDQPYLQNGRPTNFKLGIAMEYDDLHHRHARRPRG